MIRSSISNWLHSLELVSMLSYDVEDGCAMEVYRFLSLGNDSTNHRGIPSRITVLCDARLLQLRCLPFCSLAGTVRQLYTLTVVRKARVPGSW